MRPCLYFGVGLALGASNAIIMMVFLGSTKKVLQSFESDTSGPRKSKYSHPFFVQLDEDNDFIYSKLQPPAMKSHIRDMNMKREEYDILEMDYLRYIVTQQYDCRERVLAGNWPEGGWEVCLDPPFHLERKRCLVYSFGIKDDWSFDDFMTEKGCEVHSFDPLNGLTDRQRKENNYFHSLGLDGYDGEKVKRSSFQVRTLTSIKTMLGHTDRTIDYLKFDIELSEWPALATMLADKSILNVKQMAMELHTPFKKHVIPSMEQLEIIKQLKDVGFRIFFSTYQRHPYCRKHSPQTRRVTHAFINIHFVNINYIKS